jgi:integrase
VDGNRTAETPTSTSAKVLRSLGGIRRSSGRATARTCHWLIKHFFKWAINKDYLPEHHRNPVDKVKALKKNPPRERTLSYEETQRIWKACEDWEAETLTFAEKGLKKAPGGYVVLPDYARAVKLLFLMGLRAQEIGDLHWSEVDLPNREMCIEGHRTKNGKPLFIPLSDMAFEILSKIKEEADAARPDDVCVFGRGDGRFIKKRGIAWKQGLYLGDTVDKLQKRMRRGPIGFWKHELDPKKKRDIQYLLAKRIPIVQIRDKEHVSFYKIKAIQAEMDGNQIPAAPAEPPMAEDWTMHDIRRTFRTRLSECGVLTEISERLIGHNVGTIIERTYDKHPFWKEKLEAVKKWETLLRGIIDGTASFASR